MTRVLARRRDRRGGQALVEMGIVVFLFVLLTMGIIEFGRLLMIVNIVTHAARDGARAAAVVAVADRGAADCQFGGTKLSDIQGRVTQQIQNVTTETFVVTVTPACANTVPVVEVNVSGSLGLIFNIIGDSFDIDRTVAFRDESCPACA